MIDLLNIILCWFNPQWVIAFSAFSTFVVLLFYTYYTFKIAKATEENLSPFVSYKIKSGMKYFSDVQRGFQPNLEDQTRFIITNHSKYHVEVFVNLNLKLDNQVEEYHELYTGKKAWPIPAFDSRDGHFELANKFELVGIADISIDIEVRYRGESGKMYDIPPQHWSYLKQVKVWVDEVGTTV